MLHRKSGVRALATKILAIASVVSIQFTQAPALQAAPETRSDAGIQAPGAASSEGSPGEGGSSAKIRVSPEIYRNLTPEQRAIVDARMRQESQTSSETRPAQRQNGPLPLKPLVETPEEARPRFPDSEFKSDKAPSPTLTDFEQRFNQRLGSSTREPLRQYGYDLFRNAPSTFAPVDDVPAPTEYPIGAGDELIVSALSPQRSTDVSLIVNRDGTILVPNRGALPVAGLTFAAAAKLIERRIKGQASHLQVHVRLGKLRNVTITLVGQVKHPGAYSLGGLSTLSSALMACGGPTSRGSLRRIQLRRRGKVEATLDLYDFLLRGDSSQDRRLQAGDVVFVPPIGALVGLEGELNQPGIFEISPSTTLGQALDMAGGLGPEAFTRQIRIDRSRDHDLRETLDIDLVKHPEGVKTAIQDGDLVTVLPIPPNRDTSIRLDGHVQHPGKFAFRVGTTLADILRSPDDLKPEAYLEVGLIERTMSPDQHLELIPFSLAEVLNRKGDASLKLSAQDRIRVYSRWEIQERPRIRIAGAINHGGEFNLWPRMRVSELIHVAGGLRAEADAGRAELTRVTIRNNQLTTTRVEISPSLALGHDPAHDLELRKDDYLLVRPIPEYKLYRTVSIQGEVGQPGTYTFQQGEGLRDVLRRAGGLTRRAYAPGAVFTRQSVKELETQRLTETASRLESDVDRLRSLPSSQEKDSPASRELASKLSLLENIRRIKPAGRVIIQLSSTVSSSSTGQDLDLEDGDVLVVPPVINSVSIIGQVYNPSTVIYDRKRRLDEYLALTGGPSEKADRSALYVIRADGSIVSDRSRSTGIWPFRPGFNDMLLEPGDTLVVPEKVESENWIGNFKDVTQVLYQIATAAAVTWGILKP